MSTKNSKISHSRSPDKMSTAHIDPPHIAKVTAAVLDAALPDVVFDGWSEALLRRAIDAAGVDSSDAKLAFPRGAPDLAAAFHRQGDAEMLARLTAEDAQSLRIRDKITAAVRTRLEIAEPHEEAIRRAAAMYALPIYAADGAKLTWETADHIWNFAGDTADDYNWYTKRLTLSAVFSSTLLFWLGDSSEDKAATWAFLDRRIDGVMRFEKTKSALRKNPLARLALAGPKALLSRISAPQTAAIPEGLSVGLPGRRKR